MQRILFFAAALLLAGLAASQRSNASGFGFVVSSLARYQGSDGGFRLTLEDGSESTLEATSHALFLSSLYGLKNEIGTNEAIAFIKTLRNADGGYGQQAGKASDVESVREGILSLQHVGVHTQDAAAASFISSAFDENTGLFRNRQGEPDLRATAMAVDALNMLGELQRWDESKQNRIRDFLKKHAQKSHFIFPSLSLSLPLVTANYYAISLASLLGFDFGQTSDWAAFIVSLQAPSGGVYEDETRTKVTLEATAHAAASLRLLRLHSDLPFRSADLLLDYLRHAPRDLRSAAFAHLALASTSLFTDNLKTSLSYFAKTSEGANSAIPITEEITQGALITPMLTVTSFGNVAHAGLDIDLEISFPSEKGKSKSVSQKMVWSNATKQYVSEQGLDTSFHLGDVTFHYLIRCSVAALQGTFSFEVKDTKRVGFALAVSAHALNNGKAVNEGDLVTVGTKFDFDVALSNSTTEITSGDFDVKFAVIDSSHVTLHSSSLSAKTSPKFAFSFTLSDGKIPSGHLSFVISVSDSNGIHTRRTTSYSLSTLMIAAEITLEKNTYHLGEKVKVTMTPAAYENKTPLYLSEENAANRDFVLDISSKGGVLLSTIKGVVKSGGGGKSVYVFEGGLEPTLHHVGANLLTFRYLPKHGPPILLVNYDSKNSELYEDAHDSALDFVVEASLAVVNIHQRPTQKEVHYGADIVFEFQIRDDLSGKLVSASNVHEAANAFMLLQHHEAGYSHPIVSARQPASVIESGKEKHFLIHWALNANAVTGAGQVILIAQDADGKQLRLVEQGKTTPVSVDIHIGGHIETIHTHFSSSHTSQHSSVFVVQFQLKCEENLLTDALLRAAVQYRSGSGAYTSLPELSDLIVASHEGKYEVSWTLPHSEAHSGEYRVQLFREIDKLRALESIEMREQRKRREEAEERRRAAKGEEKPKDSSEHEKDVEIYELKSFLEISLSHVSSGSSISIKMDLFALLAASAVTFFITNYKTELVAKAVTKKK